MSTRRKPQKSWLIILFKCFVIGLLLQFVAHTIVTYKRWRDSWLWRLIRLWKEFLIIGLATYLIITYRQKLLSWLTQRYQALTRPQPRKNIQTLRHQSDKIFVATLTVIAALSIYSLITTLFVNGLSVGHRAAGIKYNVFPLVIMLTWYVASRSLSTKQRASLIHWIGWLVVVCLVLALWWYCVIATKPGALKLLWYNNLVFEWLIGQSPPAVYRTARDIGMARNQFLFERPTSWWFFLVMIWPLYFLLYLFNRPPTRYRFERTLFASNIFLTYSRAARGIFVLQSIILYLMTHRKQRKKVLLLASIIITWLVALLIVKGGNGITSRSFSDLGHAKDIMRGAQLRWEKPLLWHGASTAGPWSHQFDMTSSHGIISTGTTWFNPENQLLQRLIEYGILWVWLLAIFYLLITQYSRHSYLVASRHNYKTTQPDHLLVRAQVMILLGLAGLFAEWMVLHSLADRMVVYPLFALIGVIFSTTLPKLKQ